MIKKSGFLLINKPSGPTSHDIIDELRRITGERRIGHAGTLDPFATGLLIVAVGREATRNIAQFVKQDKTYVAKLHIGTISDTYDRTGDIREFPIFNFQFTNKEKIQKILQKFEGEQTQIPPMYSAKKVGGKKLYELARRGIEIERQPAKIAIHYIKLLNHSLVIPDARSDSDLSREAHRAKWEGQYSGIQKNKLDSRFRGNDKEKSGNSKIENNTPHLIIETRVSSGTYIRSLAHDIGQALGCGAYLEELERTEIGKYKLKNAIDIDKLNADNWRNFLFQV